jgi:hypothetical protein
VTPDDTLAELYVEANHARLTPVLTIRCPRRHTVARVYNTRWGLYVWTEPIKIRAAARHEATEMVGRGLELDDYREGAGLVFDLPAGTPSGWRGWRGGCHCAVYRPVQDDVLAAIAARKRELILDNGSEWHPGIGETQRSAREISGG